MAPKGTTPVASNRKARHDYEVLDSFEAGIVLRGSEVKSLRAGSCQLKDSHARIERGEVFLHGCHIAPYANASTQGGHELERVRKLLLHHHEIEEMERRMQGEPLTLVPLSVYFKDGRAKVELGLVRGKRQHDKRQSMAARDAKREAERAIRDHQRHG